MKPFFESLLKEPVTAFGDLGTLQALHKVFDEGNLLFYPSAGADIMDLFYCNEKKIDELNGCSPSLFIHCDYIYSNDFYVDFPRQLLSPLFSVASQYVFRFSENRSIQIYQLKSHPLPEKWLVYFRGFFNEEVLQLLLRKKIQVKVLYTICDGMTSGMGTCNEQQVPTVIYPLVAHQLGFRYVITEHNKDSVRHLLLHSKHFFRRYVGHLSLLKRDKDLLELLSLPENEFQASLLNLLTYMEERELNASGKLELPRGSDIVIKTIDVNVHLNSLTV